MEQLPLTFVQATVEPEIMECFEPAFNFTKLSSSNGRLAFTKDKLYWLPDNPIALMDQGWFVAYSEIESCGKYGVAGFSIKLADGKELRFSNVGTKMRDNITAAIEEHKAGAPAGAPKAMAPETEAPKAEPTPEPAAAEGEFTPEDAKSHMLMGILAYLGVLVLIPLFLVKDSKFTRFHVNQGLILLICSVVIFAIGSVFPKLATILGIINVALFVFMIIGIVNVVKGKAKELPLIGKFRIIS